MFAFRLDGLVFSSGISIDLAPSVTLVVVGPNSSGKSTLLREIFNTAAVANAKPKKVLSEIKYVAEGTYAEYLRWLRAAAPTHHESPEQIPFIGGTLQNANLLVQGDAEAIPFSKTLNNLGIRQPLFMNLRHPDEVAELPTISVDNLQHTTHSLFSLSPARCATLGQREPNSSIVFWEATYRELGRRSSNISARWAGPFENN